MTVLPAATPRTTVSYGAFVFNESTGCIVTTPDNLFDSPTDGSTYFEFDCRLINPTGNTATDDATFFALIANLESQLRIPRQRLLIQIGGVTVRDLNLDGAVTAFLITPELTLISRNSRDFHFGFRVKCQFPSNVQGNLLRRDSNTTTDTTLKENRACTLRSVWTASAGRTALQNYQLSGSTFHDAYLPANTTDQYGNVGNWVQFSDNPDFNDEQPAATVGGSLLTVTAVFLELFSGRRSSMASTLATIGDYRVLEIPSEWHADFGNNLTALQQYQDNGGAFFGHILAAYPNVAQSEWVLVLERFGFNDQNGDLVATRVYHEVTNGLREAKFDIVTDAVGLRTIIVTGAYYNTSGASARTNYTTNNLGLITTAFALETPPIVHYESHSVPKVTHYDQNQQRLEFVHTYRELAYPQGPGAFDDPNVVFNTLDVEAEKPFGAMSITNANPVTRLQLVRARFVASIDINSSGGDDPVTLWNNGLRGFVLAACQAKLGSGITSVEVVHEKVGAGLDRNQLVGTLHMIVLGGSVLSCEITQTLMQHSGRDFAPMADGTNYSAFPYRRPPQKLLVREAWLEYVFGTGPPNVFAVGDNVTSGFGLIDTGLTAQQSIDAQNASGTLAANPTGWYFDPRASFTVTSKPTTRGDLGTFQTVILHVLETWVFFSTLQPGTTVL